MQRLKGAVFFQKSGLLFFSVFATLVFLELILRFAGFGYKILKPLPKDPKSGYRIFCVGESTTAGTGAIDPDLNGYPKQLESLLSRSFPSKKFTCFFDRTIGWNSSEILLKFPLYIKKYNPDLVIIMVGVNNWWNMERSNIMLFGSSTFLSDMSLRFLIFLDHFRVWKLIKWIRFSLGAYRSRWGYWTPEAEKIDDAIKRDGTEKMMLFNKLAEHDLKEMAKICKANGIKAIFASYPMGAWGRLDLIQKNIASEFKIPFVDNEAYFSTLDNVENYLWKDRWHPNKEGYSLVARNFYDCIIKNGLI
ncbi:MAG TPA: SGNH/GDSL hydrolase family protein [Candidatus Omnitrophota bacterium]|nr:SGNH/GDSL hydrolase family protein [Candidatus Omnitrophota bacterium]